MDYPRYRRAGLPTCSGLGGVTGQVVQPPSQGDGEVLEPDSAETILNRAAYLCDDERLTKHLKDRRRPFRR